MKKSILSLVFISLFGLMSYAQGTLQFNQVKIVTNEQTVPNGKVWKVQNALPSKSISFQPFSMKINNEEIYLSSYMRGDNYWSNVASIEVDIIRKEASACTQNNFLNFALTGFEDDFPFSVQLSSGSIVKANVANYTNIFTFTPQLNNAVVEITSIRLWGTVRWTPFDLRLKVNYIDGTSHSFIYTEPYLTLCQSSAWNQTYIGTSTEPFIVPIRSKETYYLPVEFPMWLPEGATLEPGNNVSGFSVIEFNIIP